MLKILKALVAIIMVVLGALAITLYWPSIKYELTHKETSVKKIQPQLSIPNSVLDSANYPETPEAVLLHYMRLDAAGGYLSETGLEYLQQLSPVNAGMRNQMLVMEVLSDYKIKSIKMVSDDQAMAEVEFQKLGDLVNGHWFYPFEFRKGRQVKSSRISIAKFKGRWVVDTEFLSPKISATTALKYIDMCATVNATDKRATNFAIKLRSEIKQAMRD